MTTLSSALQPPLSMTAATTTTTTSITSPRLVQPLLQQSSNSKSSSSARRMTTEAMTTTTRTTTETSLNDVDGIVRKVAGKSECWRTMVSLSEKIEILQNVLDNTIELSDAWTNSIARERGIDVHNIRQHGAALADVYATNPATLGGFLHGILGTLKEKQSKPTRTRTTTTNRSFVRVYPKGILETLEALGTTGDLVVASDADGVDDVVAESSGSGSVVGVLGAGNFYSPNDVLTEMFLRNNVCVYKPHTLQGEESCNILEHILEPLVRDGYLAIVRGGVDVGKALVNHNGIDSLTLTGSVETYNRIRWGCHPSPSQSPSALPQPVVTKPICAELGGCSPLIVVPGGRSWNKGSIDRHARTLARCKLYNNGHLCVSPQVLILPENWKWRPYFMERLRYWLSKHPANPPFYPGSHRTHEMFRNLPNAETIFPYKKNSNTNKNTRTNYKRSDRDNDDVASNNNNDDDGVFPMQQYPVLITNVMAASTDNDLEEGNSSHPSSIVLQKEAWCPVLAEVPLPWPHEDEDDNKASVSFLKSALEFTTSHVNGSLSIGIAIGDDVIKRNQGEFDEILASPDLTKYGIVGVNIWPGFTHMNSRLTWGAFHPAAASNNANEIGPSGKGILGNAMMFPNVEKTVVRAPFGYLGRIGLEVHSPQRLLKISRRMTKYRLKPNLWTQTCFFSAVLLGL